MLRPMSALDQRAWGAALSHSLSRSADKGGACQPCIKDPIKRAVPPSRTITGRMFAAINSMTLDTLAAVARKDYDDRRRQVQGIVKAKSGASTAAARRTGSRPARPLGAQRPEVASPVGTEHDRLAVDQGVLGGQRPRLAPCRTWLEAQRSQGGRRQLQG